MSNSLAAERTKEVAETKRLLGLGGFAQHCEIIEDAKRNGHYVIVADYLEDAPGKRLADESHLISITDVDALVDLCRERRVDGVMNYCIDPGQKPYQQICARLGLPCYGTKNQFDILTNKDLFYETCIRHGLDVIPRYNVSDRHTAEELAKIEYPVVVKPVDSRASKGISVCWTEADLLPAIDKALSNSQRRKIIFEKFMKGDELCAKYFACDGEVFLTSFSDTYSCFVDGQKVSIVGKYFPSKYEQLYRETTDSKVREMIKSIGVQNGPLSFTGFFDDGKFRFFDPSFRLGGAQQWRIEAHVTGVDTSRCMTNFALTGSMGDPKALAQIENGFADKCAAMVFILVRLGRIGRISGLDEARRVKSVFGHCISHAEGDVVRDYGTSDHVVAWFHLAADNRDQIKQDIRRIQDVITITDDAGEDMLLPHFDVNAI